MTPSNDNASDRELWTESVRTMSDTSDYARLRRGLEAKLSEPEGTMIGNLKDHTRNAWRMPQSLREMSQPATWIEPSACREDAISEARRIAEEESAFRTGFAWCHCGRWYAADMRPEVPQMGAFGGLTEIVTVEAGKAAREEDGNA